MFLSVNFGSLYAGLSTVGYAQKKADGTDAVARTTTGVTAMGNGVYGVTVTPNAATVLVMWDTGGSTPVYAAEDIGVNVQYVNKGDITGSGTEANPWGPV